MIEIEVDDEAIKGNTKENILYFTSFTVPIKRLIRIFKASYDFNRINLHRQHVSKP